jgi:two-component system, chemotaxis family, sensor kinase CheA
MTARPSVGGLSPETLAEIRIVFFKECESHLADLEAGATALQNGDRDPERLNGAYRAAHSIKGGAGIFQLGALVGLAHRVETVLGEVRDGRLAATPEVLDVLARASRRLAELVDAGRQGHGPSPEPATAVDEDLGTLMPVDAEPGGFDALHFEPRPMTFQPLRPVGRSGPGGA